VTSHYAPRTSYLLIRCNVNPLASAQPSEHKEVRVATKPVTTLPESLTANSAAAANSAVQPAPATAAYTFTLDSFRITQTRSLHNDTDYVSIAVVVGQNPPIAAPVKSMGNVDNGTHEVNLSIPNVAVGPTDLSAFIYSIVNCGHGSPDEIEAALQKATIAAASKLAQQWAAPAAAEAPAASHTSTVGTSAFGWLTGAVEGILFADCDGVVAGGDCIFFRGEEASLMANSNGQPVTFNDSNPGSNSPAGCGANSQYYVSWSVSTKPPVPAGGSSTAGGGAGTLDPSPGNPPHRLD
jgi:hypothetical protein